MIFRGNKNMVKKSVLYMTMLFSSAVFYGSQQNVMRTPVGEGQSFPGTYDNYYRGPVQYLAPTQHVQESSTSNRPLIIRTGRYAVRYTYNHDRSFVEVNDDIMARKVVESIAQELQSKGMHKNSSCLWVEVREALGLSMDDMLRGDYHTNEKIVSDIAETVRRILP